MLQKDFFFVAVCSNFYYSCLVFIFCTTSGMHFINRFFHHFWAIIEGLQEYLSASYSWCERRVFRFHTTTTSSASMVETLSSKWSTSISSSMTCSFWIKSFSFDMLVWWFCWWWEIGGVGKPWVYYWLFWHIFLICLFHIYNLFTVL